MILRRGIYSQRADLETVLIPGDGTTNWTNVVGDVSTGLGSVSRTTSSISWNNGASFGSIPVNKDGKLQFNLTSITGFLITQGYGFIGLDPLAGSLNDFIDFAFYFRNGELRIYENSILKANLGNSFTGSETWEIERLSNVVYFKKDGVLVYTSTTPSVSELFFCCALNRYIGVDNLKIIY